MMKSASLLHEPIIRQIRSMSALGDVGVLGREDGVEETTELVELEDGEEVLKDV